ncbi:hypothetical protein NP493_1185g00140 [Ridgeia piscesae]|uniref:Uncharacterized protein n=1 Tax=Ridgeia piscesae TaxID=27915 RepID=A0AAD9KE36_RIDPI|nr:hypothetical protein NP493_1185g00140 [Ridgeia piscesae]
MKRSLSNNTAKHHIATSMDIADHAVTLARANGTACIPH